ncbi:TetR family transcriptional regulator [Stackebrandtia endophytica]|uniref:TetR family transcriptional regulator n=1 Tax=Stackebrandtia endophytica TaxID=1496996 RepID=A0A543AU82_9ACTN|nr:TetR/AcrR family transcriptional regulator [Stackebrandtia endophytica]TQL76153.1 TetR family transcriptional regulator [Stackebrandtia endophytica]
MADARSTLLSTLVDQVAHTGLTDRSLRQLATDTGTSHRMLLYHFGSRDGLITAIVSEVEDRQRMLMYDLAADCAGPAQLLEALWRRVSSAETLPFVRLFFESLASSRTEADASITSAWLDAGRDIATRWRVTVDEADLRLAVAVVRGLLIEVLATGDTVAATQSLDRFLTGWPASISP